MSLTSEQHKAELERFRVLLSKEAYQTQLGVVTGEVSYDRLLIRIESFEKENRVWILELSFLPGLENDLDEASILQCYVTLSEHTSEKNRIGVERLMVKLNAKLPIGCFGLLDNPRVVFFKHNAILPNNNPTAGDQIVHQIVSLTSYLLTTFSYPLIEIATGERTFDAVLADMPFGDVIG